MQVLLRHTKYPDITITVMPDRAAKLERIKIAGTKEMAWRRETGPVAEVVEFQKAMTEKEQTKEDKQRAEIMATIQEAQRRLAEIEQQKKPDVQPVQTPVVQTPVVSEAVVFSEIIKQSPEKPPARGRKTGKK